MYKIIGGDSKEYGPVSVDELRNWIAQGRLNAQSWVKPEGAANWQPLAAFPEFADALRAREQPALPTGTGLPAPAGNLAAWKAGILARHAELRIGYCLSNSWKLLVANFGLLAGTTAVYWLIQTICQRLPVLGLLYWIFDAVFYGGLCIVYLKRIRGQSAVFADMFSGFGGSFVQLLLAGVVSLIISWVATFCCLILPGLYLIVAWSLAVPLVADKRMEFWSAMEFSRKVVTRVWFEMAAVLLIPFVPLLVLMGFFYAKMISAIWPAIAQIANGGNPDVSQLAQLILHTAAMALPYWIGARFLLLIILLFAIGAKMFAYEDLFGSRSAPAS